MILKEKVCINRVLTVSVGSIILLLIPFFAMQFTREVHWTISDFLIGFLLLFTFGMTISFLYKKLKNSKFRYLILLIVAIIFLLFWAELAVGLFGSAIAGS